MSTVPSRVEVGLQRELIGQRGRQRLDAGGGRVEAGTPDVEPERLDRELRRVLGLGAAADGAPSSRAAAATARRRRRRAPAAPSARADQQLDQRDAAATRARASRDRTPLSRLDVTAGPLDLDGEADGAPRAAVAAPGPDVADAGDVDLVAAAVARSRAERLQAIGGERDARRCGRVPDARGAPWRRRWR